MIKINDIKHYIKNFKRVYNIEDIDWERVSIKILLSEDFIEAYKDYLNWNKISMYQPMSECFIDRHSTLVNWIYVIKKNNLSDEFIIQHLNYMNESCKIYLINIRGIKNVF